jgi:hypothetical protein
MILLIPAMESLVSDISAGDVKMLTFFIVYYYCSKRFRELRAKKLAHSRMRITVKWHMYVIVEDRQKDRKNVKFLIAKKKLWF